MAGGKAGIVALALILGAGAKFSFATSLVDPATSQRAISGVAVKTLDAELQALASAGRTDELAARLDLIVLDRTLSDVAQEWLIDRGLHALAALEPTARARATVIRLTRRAPVVHVRIDPDHGDRATPLYDAGATARFVLGTWRRNAARSAASADLAAGRTSAVDRHAAAPMTRISASVRAGIADAFRTASAAELVAQRAAIEDAIARGRRVDELALILAERLADPALFRLVFGFADPPVAVAAIASAARALDARSALGELVLASRRFEIASAAMLAIGRLAESDGAARKYLFDAIEEPDIGPSAAAALARLDDPAVSAELGRRLARADSESARRLLVLALRLDGSGAARAELERFLETNNGSQPLRREVRQWLAH